MDGKYGGPGCLERRYSSFSHIAKIASQETPRDIRATIGYPEGRNVILRENSLKTSVQGREPRMGTSALKMPSGDGDIRFYILSPRRARLHG